MSSERRLEGTVDTECGRSDDVRQELTALTARGGVVATVSQSIRMSLGVAATMVLARLLSPEDYGLVGMATAVTGLVSIVANFGLSAATIQKAELSRDELNMLFWVGLSISGVLALLAAVSAPIVARFYRQPELTLITASLAAALLFTGMASQQEALLKRRMRFGVLAVAEILSVVLGVVLAIGLALYGARYWALVGSILGQAAGYAVAVWFACRIACGWRPGVPSGSARIRPMLTFGRNVTGYGVVYYLCRNVDSVLIGRRWGSEQLGLYERATQLVLFPIQQVSAPLASVALPVLSRVLDSPALYRVAYLRMLEKLAIVTMPLAAVVIASSDWIVMVVLGPMWGGVTPIISILGVTGFLQPMCSTGGWLYLSQGRTRHLFQWGLIAGAINAGSILVGLPWGALGVAISYSVGFVCLHAPMQFWFIGRVGPVRARDFYRAAALPLVASVAALSALLVTRQWFGIETPIVGISVNCVIAIAVALSVLALSAAGRRSVKDLWTICVLALSGRAR